MQKVKKTDYKHFLIRTLLMAVSILLVLPITIYFSPIFYISKPNNESQMINYWINIQNNKISQYNNQKRIFILSGSNSLFGVNYEYLNKYSKYPVLNLSNHAGLSSYIFYRAKKIIKNGDIVIMPLEYDYYNSDFVSPINNHTTFLNYVVNYDKEYCKNSLFKQKYIMFFYYIQNVMLKKKSPFSPEQTYTMDEVTTNITVNKQHFEDRVYNQVSLYKNPIDFTNYTKWELFAFIKYCKENNIKLYAYPPASYMPISDRKADKTVKFISEIVSFYDKLGVEILGDFSSEFYDIQDLYDTDYHLIHSARDKRSKIMLKYINSID